MSIHTPGPWRHTAHGTVVADQPLRGSPHRRIAHVHGVGINQMQANARLVAASPDMYSTLATIAEATYMSIHTIRQLARAAMARVEDAS